jgi:hypothetical protein
MQRLRMHTTACLDPTTSTSQDTYTMPVCRQAMLTRQMSLQCSDQCKFVQCVFVQCELALRLIPANAAPVLSGRAEWPFWQASSHDPGTEYPAVGSRASIVKIATGHCEYLPLLTHNASRGDSFRIHTHGPRCVRLTHLQVIILVLEDPGRPVGVCPLYLLAVHILRLDLDADMPLRTAKQGIQRGACTTFSK